LNDLLFKGQVYLLSEGLIVYDKLIIVLTLIIYIVLTFTIIMIINTISHEREFSIEIAIILFICGFGGIGLILT